MKKTANVKKSEQRKAHLVSVIVIVVVALILAVELSPFGGNVRFYAKWIECGRKPVSSDVGLGFGAKVKHYIEPLTVEPIRFGQPEYFCTPLQAELAGYSANKYSYEFPHINAQ